MKKNKKRFLSKKKCVLIGLVLLVVCFLLYLSYVVNPVILNSSLAKINAMASKAVGSAVYEVVNTKIYEPLIEISKDNEGNITHLSVNSMLVNQLTRELTRTAQAKLELMGGEGVDVPIGSFTGLPIFAGRGPTVNLKLVAVGSSSARYESKFIQAGINQTLHQIYVYIDTSVDLILPLRNETIRTSTPVMISENIIVGKIPSTYLNSQYLDEMLNLVPK